MCVKPICPTVGVVQALYLCCVSVSVRLVLCIRLETPVEWQGRGGANGRWEMPERTFQFHRNGEGAATPLVWGTGAQTVRAAISAALNAKNTAFLLGQVVRHW